MDKLEHPYFYYLYAEDKIAKFYYGSKILYEALYKPSYSKLKHLDSQWVVNTALVGL